MTDLINGRSPEVIKSNLSYLVRCENCPQNHEYGCDYDKRTEECRTVNDALALIERLEAQQPKWIRVGEKLPEEKINPLTNDFDDVICACDFGGIPKRRDIRFYKFGCGHFLHGFQIMDSVVTHWMQKPELPEPPKEEQNENT